MTASELQDLIVTMLTRSGGNRRRWRIVLGPLRVHDTATHPHCDWSAMPSGGPRENDLVESLLDEVRLKHPIIRVG